MILSHQKLDIKPFNFGNISLPNSSLVKYLGVILDSKLLFKSHLDKVKKCGEQTSNQLVCVSLRLSSDGRLNGIVVLISHYYS
jgi:hypothetical protein